MTEGGYIESLTQALLSTRVFVKVEKDLQAFFIVKTSSKEAFLFVSYVRNFFDVFYLGKEWLFTAIKEENVLEFPCPPLMVVPSGVFSEYGHLSPIKATASISFIKDNPKLTHKVFNEGKYICVISPTYSSYRENISPSTVKQYAKRDIRNLAESIQEVIEFCERERIDPNNVVVYTLTHHSGIDAPIMGEGFYEYLAGSVLRKQNYLVSKRCLSPIAFDADIFAYRHQRFSNGAFSVGVALDIEDIQLNGSQPSDAAFVEAEDSRTEALDQSPNEGIGQTNRYIVESDGYFSKAILSAPFISDEMQNIDLGIVTIDQEGCKTKDSSQIFPDEHKLEQTLQNALEWLKVLTLRRALKADIENLWMKL